MITRRQFIGSSIALGAAVATRPWRLLGQTTAPSTPPNIVFVFADQWRAQATGYAGDPNVKTPHLDALAKRSINFTTAVSNCPVCSPYRAMLLTGQYPLTNGLVVNDTPLRDDVVSIAEVCKSAGYDTGYIGKWHVDGHGRSTFIPKERRQGFDFWRVLECTHKYNDSAYYGDEDKPLKWQGYDAAAQTAGAQKYIRGEGRDRSKPFLLMLSWGPPHDPYEGAPAEFASLYNKGKLQLRPNVPEATAADARKDLAGYYAHCSALDSYVGALLKAIQDAGLADNTLFVFTSDHGDMLGSQGEKKPKETPWEESIRVPLLMHCPRLLGETPREMTVPFGAPDIMPTLLGLCGLKVPKEVEGVDFSGHLLGGPAPAVEGALIGLWARQGMGWKGPLWRGVRTKRHTYAFTAEGPWLLFDDESDPYQQNNLVNKPEHAELQASLDRLTKRLLADRNDPFPKPLPKRGAN